MEEVVVPKDLESLEESRKIRAMLLQRWGCIPSSVMKADWSTRVTDLSKSYMDQRRESKWHNTPLGNAFDRSGTGARHGALSRFPQNVCRFAVKFYCPENGTVLDPFMGHNSRFESVWRCGRNYIGFDVCHEFVEMNRKIMLMLQEENNRALEKNDADITLIEADSRDMLRFVKPDTADFCITSPPFWDIEYYGPEAEQLGNAKLYGDFLYSLGTIVKNCFDVLKPGAFIAWELNDFRKDGIFYPYHADGLRLFKDVGFELWDTIIIDYGTGLLQSFALDIEAHRIVSKEHSYLIVGHKATLYKQDRYQVQERLISELPNFKPVDAAQGQLF